MKMTIPLLFTLLLCNFATPAPEAPPPKEFIPPAHAHNIILMIGDGMGISQISAGMYANHFKTNLEKFPVAGLQKALPAKGLITDSAAAATAFACGVETYNGAIGVDKDTLPVENILEEAEKRGLATGIITTSSLTNPVLAAFIAHAKNPGLTEAIAAGFLNVDADLFIGGGEKAFSRRSTDNRNLKKELKEKGYLVSDYQKQILSDITPYPQKNFAYFTAEEEPPSASEGRDYLPNASNMATFFLDNHSAGKGFFLMIDGGQINEGGRENDSGYIISEMADFDKAIGEALKFAERDGNTLVIVTGTHETGGYAINPGSRIDSLIPAFTTNLPTAALIPVFAYGPGAELFRGFYDNSEIYTKMRQAFGWGEQKD